MQAKSDIGKYVDNLKPIYQRMMGLMLEKGFGADAAYKTAVHGLKVRGFTGKIGEKTFGVASEIAYLTIKNTHGNGEEMGIPQRIKLAKAYAQLGHTEDAKQIGISMLVFDGDYASASKVFRHAGLRPEDVVKELTSATDVALDKETFAKAKALYVGNAVQEMKVRREKNLHKRQERVSEELLVPVALQIEKLDKNLKKVNEERSRELGEYENMKSEYSGLLGNTYTPENGREFYDNAKKAGKLWDKIFKRYGSRDDPKSKNPDKMSNLSKLTEKMVRIDENLEAKGTEYSENERKYHGTIEAMEKRYKQKLQKDAEKLGYKGNLFPEPGQPTPEWKEMVKSGKLDPSKAKDRKYLRKEAEKYLRNGNFKNAHDIYQTLGTLKDKWYLNRMDKYLKKDSGNEEQAAKDYYGAKMRVRKIVPTAVLTGALIGAIAGSFIPHKHTTYKMGSTVTKVEKDKTLQERDISIKVEKGGCMWNQAKKLLPPGASDHEIAMKTNQISAILGLYEDTVKVVDRKVVPGADGIFTDKIQPGEYKVGTKLEMVMVPTGTKTTYRPVVQTQEKAPWPNYGGAAAGAGLGALAGLGIGAAMARRKRQEGTTAA